MSMPFITRGMDDFVNVSPLWPWQGWYDRHQLSPLGVACFVWRLMRSHKLDWVPFRQWSTIRNSYLDFFAWQLGQPLNFCPTLFLLLAGNIGDKPSWRGSRHSLPASPSSLALRQPRPQEPCQRSPPLLAPSHQHYRPITPLQGSWMLSLSREKCRASATRPGIMASHTGGERHKRLDSRNEGRELKPWWEGETMA